MTMYEGHNLKQVSHPSLHITANVFTLIHTLHKPHSSLALWEQPQLATTYFDFYNLILQLLQKHDERTEVLDCAGSTVQMACWQLILNHAVN